MDRVKIYPFTSFGTDRLELRVTRIAGNIEEVLGSDGWHPAVAGDFTAPSYLMRGEDAQELANRLWDNGIRPEQSKQSQGAHDAQGKHLEDMRSLAFAKLNVEKPQ